MKSTRWVFNRNMRSVLRSMDRERDVGFGSLPEYLDYLDSLCICRGRRSEREPDCDPHACQREYRDSAGAAER